VVPALIRSAGSAKVEGMTAVQTRFTDLVGCPLPIQQAGMGGVSTPALAAAVARAGGLGMLAATGLRGEGFGAVHREAIAAAGPEARIGANFLAPFLDPAAVEDVAAIAPFVECFYGDPDAAVVARIHAAGSLAAWQVGSRDEAVAAADAGCDVVVVQGVEAGGHVRGTAPLLTLLADVRATLERLPLVAAGGIATGAAAAAAMAAGADAVRIGTRLVATAEADVHPQYLDALVKAGAADTELTEAFSLGWPHAPHRVLRSCIEASEADPSTRSPFPPNRTFAGDVASAALYAGTSVGDVDAVEPAEDVVRRLAADLADALERR
jgi:NAD(P)H-dependent flavin oxidoreductase YrpB (nitropropane dioxygenase family)